MSRRSRCGRVPAQPTGLAAHDERRLRVDLQVREAVDDVDACTLERLRPLSIAPLVKRAFSSTGRRSACRSRPPRSAPARAASRRSSNRAVFNAITSGSLAAVPGRMPRLIARASSQRRMVDSVDVRLRDLGEVSSTGGEARVRDRAPWSTFSSRRPSSGELHGASARSSRPRGRGRSDRPPPQAALAPLPSIPRPRSMTTRARPGRCRRIDACC